MRKRPSKKHQLDTHINAIIRQRCSGVQVRILDIPTIYNEIYRDYTAEIDKHGHAGLDRIVLTAYLRYALNVTPEQAKGLMDAVAAAPVYGQAQS